MIDHTPQKHILRPWNQWETHHLHPNFTFEIRTGAVRHINKTRGNSRLNKPYTFVAWSMYLSSRRVWPRSINMFGFPQKWHTAYRNRGLRRQQYLPPRLGDKMATRTAVLNPSFNWFDMQNIVS